jgi:MFS family permease
MKKYIFIVGLSEFASRMNFMALSMLILTFSNATWYLTAFFVARQVGGMIGNLFSGRIVDRYDRRKIMLFSDAINSLAVLIPIIYHHPLAIIVSALILGYTYPFFYVSYSSSIPEMFGQEQSPKINSLIVRIASIVSIAGFILGGFLAEIFGPKPIIVFDSLTYLVAAIFLMIIRWNSLPGVKNPGIEQQSLFSFLRNNRLLAFMIVTSFFYALAVSANNYSLPLLAATFELKSLTNGFFWSAAAFGAFLGTAINKSYKSIRGYLLFLIFYSIAMMLAFSSIISHPLWVILFLLAAGGFDGIAQVSGTTIIQKVPAHIRGRAFSLQGFCLRLGFLIGFIMCPFAVQLYSLKENAWILNGILFSWVILLIMFIYKGAGVWKKQSKVY